MANKSEPQLGSLPFLPSGQTEAMLDMQKELLKAYEESGRAWVERVKAEVALWSDFAWKLRGSSTVPEGLKACQDTFAERMEMVADDGRRLFEDGQKIIASVSRGMPNGWAKESS